MAGDVLCVLHVGNILHVVVFLDTGVGGAVGGEVEVLPCVHGATIRRGSEACDLNQSAVLWAEYVVRTEHELRAVREAIEALVKGNRIIEDVDA